MKHSFVFLSLILTFSSCQSPPSCSSISGRYSGISVMGSSSGTCSIKINVDCSAVLEYDHGSLGQAVEKGALQKTDAGFKFISGNGGGTYDISIDGSNLLLEGFNWRCEMDKQ